MDENERLRQAAKTLIDPERTSSEKQEAYRSIVGYIRRNQPKSAAADCRVMEYNILRDGDGWGWAGLAEPRVECVRRIEPLCAIVEGYCPDVIGLVERYDCWEDEGRLTERMRSLGYAIAESALPEAVRKIWDRDNPDRDFNRHPLLYRADRFECLKSACLPIQAFPSINFRVLTSVILRDRNTGEEIAFFVTHWESGGIQKEGVEPKTPDECRMINAQKAVKAFHSFLEGMEEIPAVVMGDFNTNVNDPAYRHLLTHCGLRDVMEDPRMIDLLAVKALEVSAFGMDPAPYTGFTSDHKPIYCDIVIKNGSEKCVSDRRGD